MRIALAAAMVLCIANSAAAAEAAGEARRLIARPQAGLRNADKTDTMRITVWYPAATGVQTVPLEIGPPGRAFFRSGAAAPDAPFEDVQRRPVILLSHGFGGAARMMSWFGTAMAREGYVVIAVDHPGNNGVDAMTVPGALLWHERPQDLRWALETMSADPVIGAHLDLGRVGAAGFSAGGFTALAAAGARIDAVHFDQFCAKHPDDGVCRPQLEFPVGAADRAKALENPAFVEAIKPLNGDHGIAEVRAAFAMAPALVQALDSDSLKSLAKPIAVVFGDKDVVAPPQTNGLVAAKLAPRATVETVPDASHYDFLSECTAAGRETVPLCRLTADQKTTHERTLAAAKAFFAANLR